MNNVNITAVVVTYNRKQLLLECLESLLGQTYSLQNIIIIDNNSTDETDKYLKEKGILDNDKVKYLKLEKNIGGAGGFYEGMKIAAKNNNDWVWIMDDDTIPYYNALENLLYAPKIINDNISFLCSKVIGSNNEEMNIPNVSKRLSSNGYPIWMKYLNKSIVEVNSATFVSVLINSKAVQKVGLPWKEFFIWGDDIEYTSRLSKFYGPGYAIGNSMVVHKRPSGKNLTIVEEQNLNRVEFYRYKYRNDILIAREYSGTKRKISIIISSVKDIYKILLHSPVAKYKKISIVLSSLLDGLFNIKLYKRFKERMISK